MIKVQIVSTIPGLLPFLSSQNIYFSDICRVETCPAYAALGQQKRLGFKMWSVWKIVHNNTITAFYNSLHVLLLPSWSCDVMTSFKCVCLTNTGQFSTSLDIFCSCSGHHLSCVSFSFVSIPLVLFAYGWRKSAHDTDWARRGVSGLCFGGVLLSSLTLSGSKSSCLIWFLTLKRQAKYKHWFIRLIIRLPMVLFIYIYFTFIL